MSSYKPRYKRRFKKRFDKTQLWWSPYTVFANQQGAEGGYGIVNGGHPVFNPEYDDTSTALVNNGTCGVFTPVLYNPWQWESPIAQQAGGKQGFTGWPALAQTQSCRVIGKQGGVYVQPVPFVATPEDLNIMNQVEFEGYLRWAWVLQRDPTLDMTLEQSATGAAEDFPMLDNAGVLLSSKKLLKWGVMHLQRPWERYIVSQSLSGNSVGLVQHTQNKVSFRRIPMPKLKGIRFDRTTKLILYCQMRGSMVHSDPAVGGGVPANYMESAWLTQTEGIPATYPKPSSYDFTSGPYNNGPERSTIRVSVWPDFRLLLAP